MPTFGARLSTLLRARGDITPKDQVNRLATIGRFSKVTAREWLGKTEATVSATRLYAVCQDFGVRMSWAVTGRGNPTSLEKLSKFEWRLLLVAHTLPDLELTEWLEQGERIAEKYRQP